MTDETTSVWADFKENVATAWGWLDKPAEWFAAVLSWSPKTSLLVAVALFLWAGLS